MTVNEFKMWLEGFSHGIEKTPNLEQWEKVIEKIASLKNESQNWQTFPYTGQQSAQPYRNLNGQTLL